MEIHRQYIVADHKLNRGQVLASDMTGEAAKNGAVLLPYDGELDVNAVAGMVRRDFGYPNELHSLRMEYGLVLYLHQACRVFWVARLGYADRQRQVRLTVAMGPMPQPGTFNAATVGHGMKPAKIEGQLPADGLVEGWFDVTPSMPGFYGFGLYPHDAAGVALDWLAASCVRV